MESERLSDAEREERDKAIEKDRAAERKKDYLRAFNIKLNIAGSVFVGGTFILLYFAGDYINNVYVNVAWLVLPGLLIFAFFTLKYFYLAWFTDDDDY